MTEDDFFSSSPSVGQERVVIGHVAQKRMKIHRNLKSRDGYINLNVEKFHSLRSVEVHT